MSWCLIYKSSAAGLTPCGENITLSVSGREVSSFTAVVTSEAVEQFEYLGPRRSGKEDAECLGVAGEVIKDGG